MVRSWWEIAEPAANNQKDGEASADWKGLQLSRPKNKEPIIIRTQDVHKKAYIPRILHTVLGPDYYSMYTGNSLKKNTMTPCTQKTRIPLRRALMFFDTMSPDLQCSPASITYGSFFWRRLRKLNY